MRREIVWSAWDGPGLGHLRLAVRASGGVADGLVLDYRGLFRRVFGDDPAR